MSNITNLGELKTALTRYLKRDDLGDLYDIWIDFAGIRIDQEMRLPQQEFRTIAIANARFIPLPTDFIEMRNVQVDFDGGLALTYLTPEALDNTARRVTGTPIQFYTIMNNQIELIPAPADNSQVEIELFYYAKQEALTSETSTTAVLDAFPMLYLYAALVEAMPFMEHESGSISWDRMFTDMARLLNTRAQAGRFSGNSLHMRAV
jgi:hypothetical protein